MDANAAGLVEASRRALSKPARGGVGNALFGALALEQAPGELAGIADELTVLLPWGSLLLALARAQGAELARLRALCKPGATVRIVLGYGEHDGVTPDEPAALEHAYAAAGLAVGARPASKDDIRALGTTWANKLAFSPAPRSFIELRGEVGR